LCPPPIPLSGARWHIAAGSADRSQRRQRGKSRAPFWGRPIKKALPWFAEVSVLGGAALAWSMLACPAHALFASRRAERGSVVDALDKAKIGYSIDSSTGALSVDEANLYKARMVVAQNGALAMPDTSDGLDKLPWAPARAGKRTRRAPEA
jgi:flagellar M-ring protein FliF